jgi:hypothetical protein
VRIIEANYERRAQLEKEEWQKKAKQAERDIEICQVLNSKNGGPDTVMKLRGEISGL